MKKLPLVLCSIVLLLLCTGVLLRLCSISIAPPPLEFTGHRISDSGEYDVTIINNSDNPVFEIELKFEHLPTSSKDIKKFKLLRLNPNERTTLTKRDLDGWPITRGTVLNFEARGFLLPSLIYVGGDSGDSTAGR